MYRKTVLPVILKAVNTAKLNFHVYNRKYVVCSESSSDCKNKESDDYKPRVKKEDIKFFVLYSAWPKKLQPSDMINTFLQLQNLNEVN